MRQQIILGAAIALALSACTRLEQSAAGRATQNAPTAISTNAPATMAPTVVSANKLDGSPGDFVKTIDVNGASRTFRLHVPASYRTSVPAPLVLNFHGFTSNAEQEEALSGMSAKADVENFIVAYPDGTGNPQRWNIGPQENGQADLDFVRAMISQIANEYTIDAGRIYATGISNGAEMSNHLGCEMADVFAAIAPVAGGYFRAEQCNPARPIPVIEFHGTADRLVPYNGQDKLLLPIPEAMARWATRNGCAATPTVIFQNGNVKGEQWSNCRENADVVLYTIEGGGHSWPGSPTMPSAITTQDVNATDVMWEFFVKHPKRVR